MSRRKDHRTAELIDITILTRDAFGQDRAFRYAALAGVPAPLAHDVLRRPSTALRRVETIVGAVDRRRAELPRHDGQGNRRHAAQAPG